MVKYFSNILFSSLWVGENHFFVPFTWSQRQLAYQCQNFNLFFGSQLGENWVIFIRFKDFCSKSCHNFYAYIFAVSICKSSYGLSYYFIEEFMLKTTDKRGIMKAINYVHIFNIQRLKFPPRNKLFWRDHTNPSRGTVYKMLKSCQESIYLSDLFRIF